MSIFNVMNTVFNDKEPTEEEIKSIPSFIFCRYLSSNPHCMNIANILNNYPNIPIEIQYKMVKQALKGKLKYIKYIKTKKDPNEHEDELEHLMQYFKISRDKALEYYDLISDKERDSINTIFQGQK